MDRILPDCRFVDRGFVDNLLHCFCALSIPRRSRVITPRVSACWCTVSWWVFLAWVFYIAYVGKDYLDTARISGTSQIRLEEPSLHMRKKFSQMPYCAEASSGEGRELEVPSTTCAHLDKHFLRGFGPYLPENELLPTRITTTTELVRKECINQELPCSDPYETLSTDTKYVAGLEDYVLRLEHGFASPDIEGSFESRGMQGFYSLGTLFAAQVASIKCPFEPCPVKHHIAKELDRFWGALDDPRKGAISQTDHGDFITVGKVLDIMKTGMRMDDMKPDENQTWRDLGFVMNLDIVYKNYRPYSWPNRLPVVYFYEAHMVPSPGYKVTRVHEAIETANGTIRKVIDLHGIFLRVNQRSGLGSLSWFKAVVSFFPYAAFIAFFRWVFTMYLLNTTAKKIGDKLEDKIEKAVDMRGEEMVAGTGAEEKLARPGAITICIAVCFWIIMICFMAGFYVRVHGDGHIGRMDHVLHKEDKLFKKKIPWLEPWIFGDHFAGKATTIKATTTTTTTTMTWNTQLLAKAPWWEFWPMIIAGCLSLALYKVVELKKIAWTVLAISFSACLWYFYYHGGMLATLMLSTHYNKILKMKQTLSASWKHLKKMAVVAFGAICALGASLAAVCGCKSESGRQAASGCCRKCKECADGCKECCYRKVFRPLRNRAVSLLRGESLTEERERRECEYVGDGLYRYK